MKYLMLIYDSPDVLSRLSDEERQQIVGEYGAFTRQIKANGRYVGSARLHAAAEGSHVRVREGRRLVTDGPFAETREQLGGYYLVEAGDLDEAIALAAQIPSARLGTIEVRPLRDVPDVPAV